MLREDAASLLPGHVRPALLWRVRLDAEVQGAIDARTLSEDLWLLREVGELRLALQAVRSGVPPPEQEVDVSGDSWSLRSRGQPPTEEWNAQISLLTGFAPADMMVYAGRGDRAGAGRGGVATAAGPLPLGRDARVRLVTASVEERRVAFQLV